MDCERQASPAPARPGPEPSPAPEASRRVPAIDVLRGIAILGTLAANIWIFTPGMTRLVPGPWPAALLQSLLDGKFLGLLTIMFGIGLEIQRQAARRAGRSWPGAYPVRAGLLFLDGVVIYVFVFQFDVIRAYAFTGLIVAFLLLTSERVQLWIAALFVALHVALMMVMSAERPESSGGAAPDEGTRRLDPGSYGYWPNVQDTLDNFWAGFSPSSEFATIVVMGVAMFLLGARIYRAGVFEPSGRVQRRWLMVVGLLVALPLEVLLKLDVLGLPHEPVRGFTRYGTAAVVAFGILALVAEVYQHRAVGWWGRRLADVGAMALSCYMLQNILGVAFSHTAAALVDPSAPGAQYATLALFLALAGLLVVFSGLWLRRFDRGPVELFWNWGYRTITRTRDEAVRHAAPASLDPQTGKEKRS
ncbi:predicted membrane protein [Sanguibacter keddieii DSM 10542]|uniref:Predicted membrane protein n=1 Tax=Sanguibacter keddieii (strain ATCC 51767 / DSM 10542 / NCFB 3025 / ST-74) TaxID=446469 RepID=D1BJZ7_SANKS|nr:predicted membrane protein [Sanguibacter keddieii DSM 10542]